MVTRLCAEAPDAEPELEIGRIDSHLVPSFRGADPGGDEESDDDTDDDGEDDESEDEDSSEGSNKPPKPKSKSQRRARDFKAYGEERRELKRQNRVMQEELDKLKAERKIREDAEKTDLQKAEEARQAAEEKAAEHAERLRRQALKNAFYEAKGADGKEYVWHNRAGAFTMLASQYVDDIEVDDDHEISGLDEAVAELVKDHPYLLRTADSDEGPRPRKSGHKPRAGTGSKETEQDAAKKRRGDHLQKYSALRRN